MKQVEDLFVHVHFSQQNLLTVNVTRNSRRDHVLSVSLCFWIEQLEKGDVGATGLM